MIKNNENEKYEDGLISEQPRPETTALTDSTHHHMVRPNDLEPINRFFEWPVIRDDGAYQPIQYKTVGHLLSSGVTPENIQAANLIFMCMLSARLGYPISAMLDPDNTHEAVKLLDYCRRVVPEDAVIEFPEFKPEYLYIDHGRRLDGRCIISPAENGFSKVSRDLELVLTRGHTIRQDVAKGKYKVDLSEHRSEMHISVLGINGGKPGKGLSLPSVLTIPVGTNPGIILPCMTDVFERYGLVYSPLFKIRKSFQRLKSKTVVIPYEHQLATAIIESGCDHAAEKLTILKNLISICALISNPPKVKMAELGAIMFGTDEDEISRWMRDTGLEKDVSPTPNEPIIASKVEYQMARLLLDGILITGSNRFTDREKKVFKTVKAINMGKMSEAMLKRDDDVERLSTLAQHYGYWATREKVFEIINSSDFDFSLSSVSNDLVALTKLGVLERAKPPKRKQYGYYITTMSLSDAIELPAPSTIQDPIYEGKDVLVVNPLTGEVEKI